MIEENKMKNEEEGDEQINISKQIKETEEKEHLIKENIVNVEQNASINVLSNSYKSLNAKVKENKQMDINNFFKQSLHYFIMTDGGKPVYSRYGDEVENCGILATFSAIMTKFTFFNNTSQGENKEKLHYIITDKTLTLFIKKGKLIFIALSKHNLYSIAYLNSHLEYLYIQLLSIISSDRISRLESNPSYCMTALSDTDVMFEQMILYSSNTLVPLLNSFHVGLIDQSIRSRLFTICNQNKGDSLLCLLLTPYEVITLCKSDIISAIVAHDIVLIQNLIFCSESMRTTESLVPICLPGISDAGYLQLYCKFLSENLGLVFITESQDLSIFLDFSEQSQIINDIFTKENLFQSVTSAIENKTKNKQNEGLSKYANDSEKLIQDFFLKLSVRRESISLNPRESVVNINSDYLNVAKYLICKNKNTSQIFTYKFNDFDKITEEEKIVLKHYCDLYDVLNTQHLSINIQNFFHYEKSQTMTHVIQTTDNYILFGSFNLFKDFGEINTLCLDLLKMIKNKESYFFITKY